MKGIFLPKECKTVWHLWDVGSELLHAERCYDCSAAGVAHTINSLYPAEVIVLARTLIEWCKTRKAESFKMFIQETSVKEFQEYVRIGFIPDAGISLG
jgi:hypothetical protein